MPNKFKAYRTFEENGVVASHFVDMTVDELDPGDVVIRTKYSTINYKDALSYNGAGKIMRKCPTNAGIDMAGTVEASGDPRFKAGDKVIVTGYDMGVAHDGGYGGVIRNNVIADNYGGEDYAGGGLWILANRFDNKN